MHNYGEFSTTGSVASESKSSIDSYSTPATPSTASHDEIKEYNEREVFIDLSKKLGEGGQYPCLCSRYPLQCSLLVGTQERMAWCGRADSTALMSQSRWANRRTVVLLVFTDYSRHS